MANMRWLTALMFFLASTASVCARGPENATSPQGLLFVVDGIGGFDPLGVFTQTLLPKSGVPHEIREFHWTHGKGHFLRDLQDTPHLLAKAEELAEVVRKAMVKEPNRPVFLMGHSAGTAVVLEAARRLPPGSLERIVLLSSAVSPTYDLTPALLATRGQIVSYNSSADQFYLNWGTSQFGTTDRVYGPAAGLNGFREPPRLDEEGRKLYQRLVQIPWQPHMLVEGRGGLHCSTYGPIFVVRELASWLKP